MNKTLRLSVLIIPIFGFGGAALAQTTGLHGGNQNTTDSLAGVDKTNGIPSKGIVNRDGPQTGVSGGNKNTTEGLAGINKLPASRPTE